MKKFSFFILFVIFAGFIIPIVAAASSTVGRPSTNLTDIYKLRMRLRVPVIYNNMESQGLRRYRPQVFSGELRIHYGGEGGDEAEISIPALTNMSYKIRNMHVSYKTQITGYPIWSAVGNNKTGVFQKATLSFGIDANPSYNVGDDEPDNTLILTLALVGKQFGRLNGYASGQLGCGCHAYGHVSPTRALGSRGATNRVIDIAAVSGQVYLKYLGYVVDTPDNGE